MIKRKKVGQIIFIGVLFTLSVGAIGFSSWIGSSQRVGQDINVNVGDIDYYSIDSSIKLDSYTKISLSKYGFTNDTYETGLKEATFTYTIIVDFDKLDFNVSSLTPKVSFDFSAFISNISNVSFVVSSVYKTYSGSSYNLNYNSSETVISGSSITYKAPITGISFSEVGGGNRYLSFTSKVKISYSGSDFNADVYANLSKIGNFKINVFIEDYYF